MSQTRVVNYNNRKLFDSHRKVLQNSKMNHIRSVSGYNDQITKIQNIPILPKLQDPRRFSQNDILLTNPGRRGSGGGGGGCTRQTDGRNLQKIVPDIGKEIKLIPQQPNAVARRNARERNRVKQVNSGFEKLRQRIPADIIQEFENNVKSNKKLSKLETIRMAVEYIRRLVNTLESDRKNNSEISSSNISPESNERSPDSGAYSLDNVSPDIVDEDELELDTPMPSPQMQQILRLYNAPSNAYEILTQMANGNSENLDPMKVIHPGIAVINDGQLVDINNPNIRIQSIPTHSQVTNTLNNLKIYDEDSLSPISNSTITLNEQVEAATNDLESNCYYWYYPNEGGLNDNFNVKIKSEDETSFKRKCDDPPMDVGSSGWYHLNQHPK